MVKPKASQKDLHLVTPMVFLRWDYRLVTLMDFLTVMPKEFLLTENHWDFLTENRKVSLKVIQMDSLKECLLMDFQKANPMANRMGLLKEMQMVCPPKDFRSEIRWGCHLVKLKDLQMAFPLKANRWGFRWDLLTVKQKDLQTGFLQTGCHLDYQMENRSGLRLVIQTVCLQTENQKDCRSEIPMVMPKGWPTENQMVRQKDYQMVTRLETPKDLLKEYLPMDSHLDYLMGCPMVNLMGYQTDYHLGSLTVNLTVTPMAKLMENLTAPIRHT